MSNARHAVIIAALIGSVALSLFMGCERKNDAISQAEKTEKNPPGIAETKAIAEEGFIYGLPIVMNYAVMYEYAVDRNSGQFKAPFNQIINEARVFTYKDTAIVTPNSDTPYSFLWMDLRAEPMVLSVPAVEKKRYYSVMLERRQHLQLRLHRQPRHRQRSGRLHGRRPRLEGRDPAGHQEGVPLHHAVLARGLPHPALQPGRHAQREEGAGRLQGAAAVGVSQAARAARGARDRLPEDRQGTGEDQLLRVPRLRAAVRAAGAGGEGDPREAGAASASARARPSTSRTSPSSTRPKWVWA